MQHDLAAKLEQTIERETTHLCRITEGDAGKKPAPHKWSNKEELGHLIDSACNNHARFVAAAIQPNYRGPGYQQDEWVKLHGYIEMNWAEIIDFWKRYNDFLAALVRRIPEEKLDTPCVIGDGSAVTLQFLIEDYILHMQHHLDHILKREKITQYPGAAVGV